MTSHKIGGHAIDGLCDAATIAIIHEGRTREGSKCPCGYTPFMEVRLYSMR